MKNPSILFEDNHLLAINKPFGMPSQKDQSGDLCVADWAENYLRKTYNKPGNVYVGLLHRIDRPVGGILILAKTSKAAARMSKMFQNKEIHKNYWAITERIPDPLEGELEHYLRKIGGKNIMRAFKKEVAHSKKSTLSYKTLTTLDDKALLEVVPKTGRRHQIRVQLSTIGCTIKGDVKYGKTSFNKDKSICLLAKSITFIHPIKKESMTIGTPTPTTGLWAKIPDTI